MFLQMASFHFVNDWVIFLCMCVCLCVCVCAHACMYAHIFFIHSSGDGHVSCFHVFTIVNSAAVNIGVQVSFWIIVFIFSRYMPRNRIAESYGNCTFSFVKMCVLCVSHSVVSNSLRPTRLLCLWDFPGKNTGVGYHFLLQGIFLTQELNLGLLHCRQILYYLSHQGNPLFEDVRFFK